MYGLKIARSNVVPNSGSSLSFNSCIASAVLPSRAIPWSLKAENLMTESCLGSNELKQAQSYQALAKMDFRITSWNQLRHWR